MTNTKFRVFCFGKKLLMTVVKVCNTYSVVFKSETFGRLQRTLRVFSPSVWLLSQMGRHLSKGKWCYCPHHLQYMFFKSFHFPCSDFDPGVVHIPEPVTRNNSYEGNQGSAHNVFQADCWSLLGTAVNAWHSRASVLRNMHCTGSRWSSEVK